LTTDVVGGKQSIAQEQGSGSTWFIELPPLLSRDRCLPEFGVSIHRRVFYLRVVEGFETLDTGATTSAVNIAALVA
jgi:hypothetical protein